MNIILNENELVTSLTSRAEYQGYLAEPGSRV